RDRLTVLRRLARNTAVDRLQVAEVALAAIDDRRDEVGRIRVVTTDRRLLVQHVVGGEEDLELHVARQRPNVRQLQIPRRVEIVAINARRQDELFAVLVDLVEADRGARRTRLSTERGTRDQAVVATETPRVVAVQLELVRDVVRERADAVRQ